jgi:GNAT superfamily N-acetyltransferase
MNFEFRPFIETDLVRCAQLSVDAWPISQVIAPQDTDSLMKAYVRISLILSDYSEICYYNNEVLGFLFGMTSMRYPDFNKRLDLWKLLWGFITGKYGRIKRRFRFLLAFLTTMIKVEFLCSKFDSEIVLFVVDGQYRGKGIGKALVNHFIDYAKQNKKETIYLYTDIESNWPFYEKTGFTKYKDFYDPEVSFLRGERTMSFIYYKKL